MNKKKVIFELLMKMKILPQAKGGGGGGGGVFVTFCSRENKKLLRNDYNVKFLIKKVYDIHSRLGF